MHMTFCSIARQKNNIYDLMMRIFLSHFSEVSSKWHSIDSFKSHKRDWIYQKIQTKNWSVRKWAYNNAHIFRKKFAQNFDEDLATFKFILCDTWFFKASSIKSQSSENDHSLIEEISFVVETNRINFELCKKIKKDNRNDKKKKSRFVFYFKKKNENSSKNVDAFNDA